MMTDEERRLRHLEHKRKYREANREKIKERSRLWRENNAEAVKAYFAKYRANAPNREKAKKRAALATFNAQSKSMFKVFQTIKNPDVVRVIPDKERDTVEVLAFQAKGEFARITSLTAKEFQYLRMLEHNVDKFTPHNGNGVFVRIEKIKAVIS